MQHAESVRVLVSEHLSGQDGQDFFRRQSADALDQAVGNLRAPVRKAFERILRRELDHLFLGEAEQLRVGASLCQNQHDEGDADGREE